MDKEELITKAKEFEIKAEKVVKSAIEKHRRFLKLYPFREHAEKIDLLTPEKIYNPGADDYFFLWIEHKLKDLGHLRIGSALVWENARDNSEKIKDLLRMTVDDSATISQKIDSHWEDIKGFGKLKPVECENCGFKGGFPRRLFHISGLRDDESDRGILSLHV